ncbi:hypothetical protein [Niveispirillum irakense]|uniref:hypothetical protein n=1 Tax=Niveispirillum irakense TaxID=34011 RepID=UPI00041ECF52|nr:hypothetical protein [Niveispirillum irakense]
MRSGCCITRKGVERKAPTGFDARKVDEGEAILFQRMFSHFANGVLIYAIFYALLWLLMLKTGALLAATMGDGVPDLVEGALIPFVLSALAAFLAHAGLRVTLKRLRLKLSTPEATASSVFLGVLTLFAFSGIMGEIFQTPESVWWSPLCVIFGAWVGAAIRRRLPL